MDEEFVSLVNILGVIGVEFEGGSLLDYMNVVVINMKRFDVFVEFVEMSV